MIRWSMPMLFDMGMIQSRLKSASE